jgi:hypothetical protein
MNYEVFRTNIWKYELVRIYLKYEINRTYDKAHRIRVRNP